ncbi:GPW/gp25 family protein [Serratia rhizosphaerae]|uniref:GPW/gp25 family protein n=1 Tax=unclassified Serratia (in: enterobacteria) TaxID=2647522 RepID=UPI000CF6B5B9|nr:MULTISPECIES: GPW/gp25 family protein [unclassified Serratia (in: enterobacteria)]MCA4821975.1 GPW/gp25 family protein [Serratia rubidaea]AVJ16359.1 baseplate assembly protein [Serratia sp. MYb239]QNK31695.1 GPW/gp25 family protein [Serratia sp. JUb9]CAE1142830.1 Baseplate assembly protein [Serratia sp. Tan611]SQJ28747.1 Phage P2 baseplate assembly protein gpV [Serratia rubidaea]
MNNAKYIGMGRNSGRAINDIEHIRQSVSDILVTPIGSRVMRRQYGSLLSALLDQPQNDALRLQIMAACYSALLQWEPRIRLTEIAVNTTFDGKMVVDLTGSRTDTPDNFSLSVSVS